MAASTVVAEKQKKEKVNSCVICVKGVKSGVWCTECNRWAHFECAGINKKERAKLKVSKWVCTCCESGVRVAKKNAATELGTVGKAKKECSKRRAKKSTVEKARPKPKSYGAKCKNITMKDMWKLGKVIVYETNKKIVEMEKRLKDLNETLSETKACLKRGLERELLTNQELIEELEKQKSENRPRCEISGKQGQSQRDTSKQKEKNDKKEEKNYQGVKSNHEKDKVSLENDKHTLQLETDRPTPKNREIGPQSISLDEQLQSYRKTHMERNKKSAKGKEEKTEKRGEKKTSNGGIGRTTGEKRQDLKTAEEEKNEKTTEKKKRLIGDSVTFNVGKMMNNEGWKVNCFPGIRADQMGRVVKDTIEDAKDDEVVVVQVATNSVKGWIRNGAVGDEVWELLNNMQRQFSSAEILVLGIVNRKDVSGRCMEWINDQIEAIAIGMGMNFINVNNWMWEDCLGWQGVQLNRKGNDVLASIIRGIGENTTRSTPAKN